LVNVIILFGRPIEQEEFDHHFIDTHMPLVRSIPNLESVTINQVAGAAQGDAPYYMISELGFASETAMQDGLNSDAGQAMAKDMSNFASGGVTVLFAHATNEKLGESLGTA
jgi:uncharacterized protein (TIGR02118 family)